MIKFKFLLWVFAKLLQRKIKTNANCARYVQGKSLLFQIRTADGAGRHYAIKNGVVSSARDKRSAQFTLSFVNAAKGFEILSAKDAKPAFLRGVGSKELTITGDFLEVLWFQGLTEFFKHQKSLLRLIAPHFD